MWSRARKFTIRRAGGGQSPGVSDKHGLSTPPRGSQMARSSSQPASLSPADLSEARKFTIRAVGLRRPLAALPPHAASLEQPCCPTAKCSLKEVLTLTPSRAPNCTIQRAEHGRSPAISPRRAAVTPPPCCRMEECLPRLGSTAATSWQAPKSMIRRARTEVTGYEASHGQLDCSQP